MVFSDAHAAAAPRDGALLLRYHSSFIRQLSSRLDPFVLSFITLHGSMRGEAESSELLPLTIGGASKERIWTLA